MGRCRQSDGKSVKVGAETWDAECSEGHAGIFGASWFSPLIVCWAWLLSLWLCGRRFPGAPPACRQTPVSTRRGGPMFLWSGASLFPYALAPLCPFPCARVPVRSCSRAPVFPCACVPIWSATVSPCSHGVLIRERHCSRAPVFPCLVFSYAGALTVPVRPCSPALVFPYAGASLFPCAHKPVFP